uniref:SFRICE_024788 n=1 Tax=Spodoptera frugiperda TaxID=7108 RepID=A0A2H1VPV9_SPOFR
MDHKKSCSVRKSKTVTLQENCLPSHRASRTTLVTLLTKVYVYLVKTSCFGKLQLGGRAVTK